MDKLTRMFEKMRDYRRGQTMAEYALIAAPAGLCRIPFGVTIVLRCRSTLSARALPSRQPLIREE